MRVVIAEDSVLLREGLVQLLARDGIEVVAAVADADDLVRAVEEARPDLALIDVRMPPTHSNEGIRAALALRQKWPQLAIIILSQYVEERYAIKLLANDTSRLGYLLKDRVADVPAFLATLRRVASGGTALDPEVVSQLLARHRSDPLELLSRREREVLALMAEGRSNSGIAAALFVSESAVAKHVNSIFTKLDLDLAGSDHRRVLAVLRFLDGGERNSANQSAMPPST
ncbi:MAG: response regulator transcription factor [Streptosporangiaceae bacterium]|nr:response regulator transcription factor [Streptosporangiaceae bacterium]